MGKQYNVFFLSFLVFILCFFFFLNDKYVLCELLAPQPLFGLSILVACMCARLCIRMCTTCMKVPTELRRGHRIPRSWSYRWLCDHWCRCWELNPARTASSLNPRVISSAPEHRYRRFLKLTSHHTHSPLL